MLTRHIIGYIPSFIVPALAAFAAIFCYTRLLTPEEFGHYALTTNAMVLLVAVFYNWLLASLPRLLPQAVREGNYERFRITAQVMFLIVSAALAAGVALCIAFVPLGDFRIIAWPALFLTLSRALLNLNQSFHRSDLNFMRYNMIECGQAVLGFCIGLALVYFGGWGAYGAIVGLICGMLCMGLVDLGMWVKVSWRAFSTKASREITHFSLPLLLSFGLAIVISTSDRFLIQYFCGPEQVGIYAAGYTLTDRILGIVFLTVAIPSLPITVYRLEQEGVEAAQNQTWRNGIAAFMFALPVCAGLIMADRQIVHTFLGPAFRNGALKVMPWVAVSGMLNGLVTHYFDHAFHLGKKTRLFAFTLCPAALLNIALNLMLIPRYGYMGAAWATLASYTLLLVLSVLIGRKAFRIRFPFRQVLQIAGAVTLMAIVLHFTTFPENAKGLIMMVVLGGVTYGLGLLLLDVMDSRMRLRLAVRFLSERLQK